MSKPLEIDIVVISNEIEAAIVYDFFAIALQGSKSRLNFKNDCEILADMINSYFEDARTLTYLLKFY